MADSNVVAGPVLAKLLNLTERRLQQLAKEGVIPRQERGKYPLIGCVNGYVKFLQDKLAGSGDARDLSSERAKLARIQSEHTELRVKQLRGELVPAAAAVHVLEALASAMKTRLTSMPYVLKQRHPEVSAGVVSEIRDLIEDALRQVAADGLPREYRVSVPEGDRPAAADRDSEPESMG